MPMHLFTLYKLIRLKKENDIKTEKSDWKLSLIRGLWFQARN